MTDKPCSQPTCPHLRPCPDHPYIRRPDPPREPTLDEQLATVLKQLEMVSSAATQRYDSSGGDGDGLPSLGARTADAPFRDRLDRIDEGWRRRRDKAREQPDVALIAAALEVAGAWRHSARESVLKAARGALEALTGRNGEAPTRRAGKLDTPSGLEAAIRDEARKGVPADEVATRLDAPKGVVRRIFVAEGIDPHDGQPLTPDVESNVERARRLFGEGKMTQKQIALLLKNEDGTPVSQSTISRWLAKKKRAA